MIKRLGLVSLLACAAFTCGAQSSTLPQIRPTGAGKQFYVDGKPFIMLAGELHNSSASGVEYMAPIWDKLANLHVNTVIGSASWELVEPEEGRFDFTAVDAEIREARQRKMHLVLIWFGAWKNAGSSYVPYWVKADRKRFPPMALRIPAGPPMIAYMVKQMEEQGTGPLSPFSQETATADARAFRVLMKHIRDTDPQHTVIMMQVENEAGALGDSRDRSAPAEAAWHETVPLDLMNYLTVHKQSLLPELQELWAKNGYKTRGTWEEIFGNDEWADEIFMAYHMGRFINNVAKAGKAELDIPMYVNAWLGPQPKEELPGQWPSGGPVARVMDIYRAAAPSIDLIAPDIYVPDFKGTCALYARSGNPLFIPEARDQAGNLFWALGQYSALGWSVFGIEDVNPNGQVSQAYDLLSEMVPQLAEWQAAGRVKAILVDDGEQADPIVLGGYRITLKGKSGSSSAISDSSNQSELAGGITLESRSLAKDTRAFAIVVNTAPDEFLFIGANGRPRFATNADGGKVIVASQDEGTYKNGKWVPGRRINGDEAFGSGLPFDKIGMLKIKLLRVP